VSAKIAKCLAHHLTYLLNGWAIATMPGSSYGLALSISLMHIIWLFTTISSSCFY